MVSLRELSGTARVVSLSLGFGALSTSCGLLYDYGDYQQASGGAGATPSTGGAAASGTATGGSAGSGTTSGTCVPATCLASAPCGTIPDGCGGTLDCGLCLGAACGSDPACGSHHCVDGVCCDSPCVGACMACSAARKGSGVDGSCGPIAAGTDPDAECEDQGPASCGLDGSCDGTGACERYPAGTTGCTVACVNESTGVMSARCGTGGACEGVGVQTCDAQFACYQGTCPVSCQGIGDAACSAAYHCSGIDCVGNFPANAACTRNRECAPLVCAGGQCG